LVEAEIHWKQSERAKLNWSGLTLLKAFQPIEMLDGAGVADPEE
jgi:hypothetical protein